MRMASGTPLHTISHFVYVGCARPGGPGEFQHLYGTLRAAAIHAGMSPDCRKLGLDEENMDVRPDLETVD